MDFYFVGLNRNAHALQHTGKGLDHKYGFIAVAGTIQANHQTIADQLILAYSLDVRDVLDAHPMGSIDQAKDYQQQKG